MSAFDPGGYRWPHSWRQVDPVRCRYPGGWMRRREFIAIFGSMVASWPIAAQAEKLRRVGIFFVLSASDPENQARLAIFMKSLQVLGWIEGQNIQFDVRYGEGDQQ